MIDPNPNDAPILLWLRRDFRLSDHPAFSLASEQNRVIIPVYLLDEVTETFGAASKWRLNAAIEAFSKTLHRAGSGIVLRRGAAVETLTSLARETGARDVWWLRAYDPQSIERDTEVKSALKNHGLNARSFEGHVLFEPWTVIPNQGAYFKVYTPMWRRLRDAAVPEPNPAPQSLRAPSSWPKSDRLTDWKLDAFVRSGAASLRAHAIIGEAAAMQRLSDFARRDLGDYRTDRDFPAKPATSRLSESLAWGEIGVRTVWHAGLEALRKGHHGAEHFLKEVMWREFAYHLVFHTPWIVDKNWNPKWEGFPWSIDEDDDVLRWKQGRTGYPFVDAAMREMYVTGTMHNRGRMVAASFLTKHMLKHWQIGQRWFEDCLTDWDPASNALGWQWVAGSGPDAAPFFRVFNPLKQSEKFDPKGDYARTFLAELSANPGDAALSFFAAAPKSWGLSETDDYPADPVIDLAQGRDNALSAYARAIKAT